MQPFTHNRDPVHLSRPGTCTPKLDGAGHVVGSGQAPSMGVTKKEQEPVGSSAGLQVVSDSFSTIPVQQGFFSWCCCFQITSGFVRQVSERYQQAPCCSGAEGKGCPEPAKNKTKRSQESGSHTW